MKFADRVIDAATRGFGGLDASMLPKLRRIRRNGPASARRAALLASLHLGGEKALDPAELAVLRRLIRIKLLHDRPQSIYCCYNAWLTVRGGDQQGIMRVLGLNRSTPVTYELGDALVAHLGHGGPDRSRTWRHVFISPRLNDWTVVAGPSCDPDTQPEVEGWIEELSAVYGEAQAYCNGAQGEGDAWLVGSRGRIIRRFSSAKLETSRGEPLPIELRALDGLGLAGPPEQLDYDETGDLYAFIYKCHAYMVAAELGIDPMTPATWPTDLKVDGQPLIAWPESDDDVSILRGCYVFRV